MSFFLNFFNPNSGGGGGPGSDTTAIHKDTPNEISSISNKITPASNDIILIEDSAASFNKKKNIGIIYIISWKRRPHPFNKRCIRR